MMKHIVCILIITLVFSGCVNGAKGIRYKDTGSIQGLGDIDVQVGEDKGGRDQETNSDQGQESIEDRDKKGILTGTWHHNPVIGAGYGQRYHFFDDGKYIFEYSQYDEEKTVISEAGTWSVANGVLMLIVNSRIVIEGGERGEPGPSSASEYSIVNGIVRTVVLDAPEKEEYRIDGMFFDEEGSPGYWAVDIKGARFWKLHDDPYVYQNEPVKDGDVFSTW